MEVARILLPYFALVIVIGLVTMLPLLALGASDSLAGLAAGLLLVVAGLVGGRAAERLPERERRGLGRSN